MVRKKIYTLAYTLCIYSGCSGMLPEEAAAAKPIESKHIIFDLGYFIQLQPLAAAKKLGVVNIARSVLTRKLDPAAATQELFGILNAIKIPELPEEGKDDEGENLSWHQNNVPPVMKEWLKGKMPGPEALEAAKGVIQEKYPRSSSKRGRMNIISSMVFDPEQCAEIFEPNAQFFQLAQHLQKEGHVVHILGNWPSDAKKSIRARFEKDFSQINGCISVSGDLGAIKCRGNTAIYAKFLARCLPTTQQEDVVLIEQTRYKKPDEDPTLDIDIPEKITYIPAHPEDATMLKARLIRAGLLSDNDN